MLRGAGWNCRVSRASRIIWASEPFHTVNKQLTRGKRCGNLLLISI